MKDSREIPRSIHESIHEDFRLEQEGDKRYDQVGYEQSDSRSDVG